MPAHFSKETRSLANIDRRILALVAQPGKALGLKDAGFAGSIQVQQYTFIVFIC